MDVLFFLCFLLSFIALIIGVIKPDLVIRWGKEEKRNRKNVFKYFGLGMLAFFILFVITISTEDSNPPAQEANFNESNKAETFVLFESDDELLKEKYADFSDEQISRYNEIKENYKDLDENLKQQVKEEIKRLELEENKYEKEKYDTEISRDDIARDKDGLKGSYVKFKGEIIQVIEGYKSTEYRMAVNNDYDQIIVIEIPNEELDYNILEGDQIAIEGVSMGNETYKTVLGEKVIVPYIKVDNYYEESVEKEDLIKEVKIGDTFELSDFEITVNSIKKGKDYEGNDAIIINYNWTNNSEETTNWMFSITTQVFQNGEELDSAIISGSDNKGMKDIRPGTTLEGIEDAFKVNDESEIELEITEAFSFNNDKVLIILDFPTN